MFRLFLTYFKVYSLTFRFLDGLNAILYNNHTSIKTRDQSITQPTNLVMFICGFNSLEWMVAWISFILSGNITIPLPVSYCDPSSTLFVGANESYRKLLNFVAKTQSEEGTEKEKGNQVRANPKLS